MSFAATLILAWAAVHAYVGIFHGILHLRRRSDREYLAFSVLAFGLAVYCFGEALLTDAGSLAAGTHAMRIAMVGLAVAGGALVDLVLLLVGEGQSRLSTVAWGWAIASVAANLAGLFYDPLDRVESTLYHEPDLQVVGLVWAAGACLACVLALVRAIRFLTVDSDVTLLIVGVACMVVAGIHDVSNHEAGPDHPYLIEHASVITTFVISYMLMRRFVRAGDELTKRTDELRRSYEDLWAAQEALVRKEQLAAVGELSAVIAHEVRNPLAVMKNAVSGLRRSNLADDDRVTLLEIMEEEADRLNRLVRDLLAYARPVALRGQPVEVGEVVQGAIDTAGPWPASVDLELSLGGGPTVIHCDQEVLTRALANVVENALQAMPAGGTLTIESEDATARGRQALALVVRDTGEGMDTLVRTKARDPFFTTRPSGTGLGLAIVEGAIRAHGGELTIESRYGSGTNVRIVLPVDRPTLPPD